MEKSKRLFTAVRFPEKTIDEISQLQDLLREIDSNARYVTPISNFHITLYYIGPVNDVENYDEAFKNACAIYQEEIGEPINIEFSDLDCFRNRRGNILYLGIKPNENLNKLQKIVVKEFQKINPDIRDSRYTPHITIARKFNGDLIEDFKRPEPVSLDKAALVWSHRVNDILTYDNLSSYPLV